MLLIAPIPVAIPQPRSPILSNGALLSILATAISGKTVNSEKVEQPVDVRHEADIAENERTHEMIYWLPVKGKSRCTVRHDALPLGCTNFLAKVALEQTINHMNSLFFAINFQPVATEIGGTNTDRTAARRGAQDSIPACTVE